MSLTKALEELNKSITEKGLICKDDDYLTNEIIRRIEDCDYWVNRIATPKQRADEIAILKAYEKGDIKEVKRLIDEGAEQPFLFEFYSKNINDVSGKAFVMELIKETSNSYHRSYDYR